MAETYGVNHGGLMRCCLLSLDEEMVRRQAANEPLMQFGQVLHCAYCNAPMKCNGKQWEWAEEIRQ